MSKKFTILFISILLLAYRQSFCQQKAIDSLQTLLENAKEDTAKVSLMNLLGGNYWNIDPDKSIYYGEQAILLSEKNNYKKELATAYSGIGVAYRIKGIYDKSLEYQLKGLKIVEELNDSISIAIRLGNIGTLFYAQGNQDMALEYYLRSFQMFQKLHNQNEISAVLSNIGIIYSDKQDYDKALEYYNQSLKIEEEVKNLQGIAEGIVNIANIFYFKGEWSKALEKYLQALKKFEELDDKSNMAACLINIGAVHTDMKNFDRAEISYQKALNAAKEAGVKLYERECYSNIASLYAHQKNYEKAYEYYQLYSNLKDTLFNEESGRQIAEMQTKYETGKKEKEIEVLNVEKEKQAAISSAESKKQRIIILSVTLGLLMVIVFSIFMWRRWQITQRQKKIIESAHTEIISQKKIIEEKNKDITDSIEYASRIQQAILPEPKEFQEMFPDSFVLYKPKDIVAGDFYWASKNNGSRFLLTADCTGHGVPGAFMSMIGSSLFNEVINEKNILSPDLAFHEVRKGIIRALRQKGNEYGQKDGMDAVLCRFFEGENGNIMLECSCANNAIIILKSSGNAIEIPSDRFPVGTLGDTERPFTLHTLELKKGDIVYSFTDGYADQFGGPKGKKFKYSQFEKLLTTFQEKTMTEQREILNKTIDEWKGELEQIDDICIIGVKV